MIEDTKFGDEITWKISIISSLNFLPALEETIYAACGDYYPSVTAFEIVGDIENRLMEVYFDHKPDTVAMKKSITTMAEIFDIEAPEISLEKIDNKNWVAESQKILKPIDAGRFYLCGNHDVENIPKNKISILMEAGQAFGTGSHETTKGCLLAISALHQKINPSIGLDLGCGSGVLAIAMAKQWQATFIASDIDPIATDTTTENISLNHTSSIKVITCDGFENTALGEAGPYDIIVANILAAPLKDLAPDIICNLHTHGYLVLSGLLKEQEKSVLEVYEGLGMELDNTFPINEWQTLVLRKSEL